MAPSAWSHGMDGHLADMYAIFPFVYGNRSVDCLFQMVNEYIDNPYRNPGEKCYSTDPKRPRRIADHPKYGKMSFAKSGGSGFSGGQHRIWFHWGFNRTDVSRLRNIDYLRRDIDWNIAHGIISADDEDDFWNLILLDVRDRNKILMNQASKVLGYGPLGSVSHVQRKQINAFVTMLYCIHVIGDHEQVRTDIICPMNELVADVENAIRELAGPHRQRQAAALIKQLSPYSKHPRKYLNALSQHFSPFLMSLDSPMYNYSQKFSRQRFKLK